MQIDPPKVVMKFSCTVWTEGKEMKGKDTTSVEKKGNKSRREWFPYISDVKGKERKSLLHCLERGRKRKER